MKTRPINKALLLTFALTGCVSLLVATTWAEEAGASQADSRLVAAMDVTDLEYEIDEDSDVKVILAWDDNRSHAVWANTITETYEEEIEIREVWGIVAEYESTDDMPKDVLVDLMTANFQLKFGKYAIIVHEGSGDVRVLFIVTVAADLDGATLAKIIDFVGMVADEKEKEVEDPENPDVF